MSRTYRCTDGHADVDYEADSPREAAEAYVADGDWGQSLETSWVTIYVTPLDDDGEEVADERDPFTVAVPATEPDCLPGYRRHGWGEEEVQAHGGGVVVTTRCELCGLVREYDSWAQRRDTGEQGLRGVSYHWDDDDDTTPDHTDEG